MSSLDDILKDRLDARNQLGLLRVLKTNATELIDFTSNDYLGLAGSIDLLESIQSKVQDLNIKHNGATGSRLLSGNSSYTEDVEQKLATLFSAESALIFNSGYSANLAVLSSIPQRNDTILYDELAHASMKDGARLSLAKRMSFKHNDLSDLESKIRKATGKVYIAVESIYSMDGDECPLRELIALSERYDACIILDEAHSTGVRGKGGAGLAVSEGLENNIAIRIYTFGKAMGIHGACVAGSDSLRRYLINFARPFIYTTALPPHNVVAIDCAFDHLGQHIGLQKTLQDRINSYLTGVTDNLTRTQSSSAIQTFIVPGNENAKRTGDILRHKGFDVRPILSPTVAAGSERLRICLHTYNTPEQIRQLTDALHSISLSKINF